MEHNFVTHISRYQESVEQFIAGCPQHEQKPKTLHEMPEELVQFRKHQLDNPTCLHSKSSDKCKLFSVAVWEKTFRECLLITTISATKQQHNIHCLHDKPRSGHGKDFFCRQMFRLSSTFSQELDDAVPHAHWHQRSDCFDAFSNPDQQPPAAEHQLHNCISKEHDKQQAPPRKELYHIRKVACEEQRVSLLISG